MFGSVRYKLKGWKTVLINVALTIIPVLELSEFANVLPDEYLKWYALGMAIVNIWLRAVTSTPMGKKY